MPLLARATAPAACPIVAVFPAEPGRAVTAGTESGPVIAWAQIADPQAAGGIRIDPVFLTAGRVWTPDQYRAANGSSTNIYVK